MQRPDELTVEQIRAYLNAQAAPARPAAHVRAYREAAAVLAAIRDPGRLRPLGPAPPGAALQLLGPDLIPATGAAFHGHVMLAPKVRAETVADLVASGRVSTALAANPAERSGAFQARLERYLLRDSPPPLELQTLAELDATLQISVWLAGVVEGVPAVQAVQARAGYLRLLAPFETLAGDAVFRGRRGELDHLRRYIGVLPPESALERLRGRLSEWLMPERRPAVSISGVGGAGKSALVARFALEHTRVPEQERIPFGYLDFARTILDVGDPVGLGAELLRQLDLQFPGIQIGRGFEFLDEWRPGSAVRRAPESPRQLTGRAMSVLMDILGILASRLGPRPYVIVLDTFEEVQYRGEARAHPFWDLLSELQDRWPFLRVVVAGRAPVDSPRLAGRPPYRIELGDLDAEAAAAFLGTQGIGDPRVQREVIETFGLLPLSLRLVSSLAARTPGGVTALVGPGADGIATVAASDEVKQAQLYDRFLDHIADERVRRLAHPGLTLRRISPAVILNVLNEPCGLLIDGIEEAKALFEELRRESSLVLVDIEDGDLVHRPDLRRVMLKMLLNGAPAMAGQIHERAVRWYGGHAPGGVASRRARAEYVYHWLQLHHPELPHAPLPVHEALDDREVRASIQASIEEFPVAAQRWLATQGLEVPETVRAQASRDETHAAVAARIEGLLPYAGSALAAAEGAFQDAYAGLRDSGGFRSFARSALGLADRGASPVLRAGARVAAQRGDDDQALALIEEGLERAARDGAAQLTLGLLKERAWLYRDRPCREQAEGLALLAGYADRHQDLAARLQHRAQSMSSGDAPVAETDLAALTDLLARADPGTIWGLVPALGRAVKLSVTPSAPVQAPVTLLGPLIEAVIHPSSPFRRAAFPDRRCQDSLDEVLESAGYDPPMRPVFTAAFLRLCQTWPYRILYVEPPQGRRGEQLKV